MNVGVLFGDNDPMLGGWFTDLKRKTSKVVRGTTHAALNVATKLPVVGQYAQTARSGLSAVSSLMSKTGVQAVAAKTDGAPFDVGPQKAGIGLPLLIGVGVLAAVAMAGSGGGSRKRR